MENEQIRTSPWVKLIGVSVAFIAVIIGYSVLSTSMNEGCKAKAMQSSIIVTVHDTKWNLAGCQYLYSINTAGAPTRWTDGDVFESIYFEPSPE